MKCDELKSLARDGLLQAKLAEADVRAHLAGCAQCEALYGANAQVAEVLVVGTAAFLERGGDKGWGFDPRELDVLRDEVNASVTAEAKELGNVLRDRPTGVRRAVVLGSVLGLFGLCLALSPRGDLFSYPWPRLVVEVVLLFTLVGVAVWEGTRPLTEPLRPSKSRLILLLCVIAPVVLALGSAFLPVNHTSGTADLDSMVGCLSWGTAVALPALLVLWLSQRKNSLQEARGPLLAATLGVAGNLLLQVHCSSSEFLHLICAHAPLVVVFALGIGLLGRMLNRDGNLGI